MHIVYSGIKRSWENEINNNKNKNATGGDSTGKMTNFGFTI
jgi:hypothetical protein